jgi:hypothetical protein
MAMPFTQLDPYLPLQTPKGSGYAVAVLDYSQEHHILWLVVDDATGEIWAWPNPQVRAQRNISLGRTYKHSFDQRDLPLFP